MEYFENNTYNRFFKKIMAVLLSVFFLLSNVVYNGLANAPEDSVFFNTADDGIAVRLLKNGLELAAGDTVFSADELFVQYDFNITGDKAAAVRELLGIGTGATAEADTGIPIASGGSVFLMPAVGAPTTTYVTSLPLPDGLVYTEDEDTELYTIDSAGNQVRYGRLSIVDGSAFVTFEGGFWELETEEDLLNASISVRCRLDMNIIGTDDHFQFYFTGVGTFNLAIGDNIQLPMAVPANIAAYANLGLEDVVDSGFSVKLSRNDVLFSDGDTVFSTDSLSLRYDFEITVGQADIMRALVRDPVSGSGSYSVSVPMPEGLSWTGSASTTVLENTNNVQWGELYIDAGVATLTFKGDFWFDDSMPDLEDAFITLGCMIDMAKIGSDSEYLFRFVDQSTINLVIGDNNIPNLLTKNGIYDADTQEITWTLNYKPGFVLPTDLPITLSDTFSNQFLSYVDGSFAANPNVGGSTEPPVYTGSETTIAYVMGAVPASDVVFTYRTAVKDEAFNALNIVTDTIVSNSAVLISNFGNSLLANPPTKTVTIPASSKRWIEKSSKSSTKFTESGNEKQYTVDVSGKVFKWEIEVTTYDFGITDLWLRDKIPAGHVLKLNSIEINSTVFTPDASNYETNTDVDDGTTTFGIKLPMNSSNKYEKTYIVTYSTEIDDETFLPVISGNVVIGSSRFVNEAWLDITLASAEQIPRQSYSVGIGYNNHMIQKSGTYDSSAKEITWTVTLNPNLLDVKSGTITDELAKSYAGNSTGVLTYVADSFASGSSVTLTDLSDPVVVPTNPAGKKLIFTVGDIGKKAITFTFKTTVDDAYFLHNHSSLNNIIDFAGEVNINGTPTPVTDSVTANVKCPSTVLAKFPGGYDYDNNTITWRIVVDSNDVVLGNVKLVDTIGANQSFVPGSVCVGTTATPTAPLTASDGTVRLNGSALTVELYNVDTMTYVTFQTKIDVGTVSDFQTSQGSGTAEFENTVTMTEADNINDTATATQKVENKVLGKNQGTITGNKVPFSIEVDVNRVSFTNDLNCTLNDKIPAGMMLDLDSVELYTAVPYATSNTLDNKNTNTASYSITKGSKATYGTDYTWSFDSTENTLILTLLKQNRYVLEYDCYAVDPKVTSYNNTVELTGTSITDAALRSAFKTVSVSGGGATSMGTVAALNLTKQDGDTNDPLSNAVFELWTELNGDDILVQSATTNTNGELVFYPLRAGRYYWITERTATAGYDSSTALIITEDNQAIAAKTLDAYLFTVEAGTPKSITVTNDKIITPPTVVWPNIKITKTDTAGNPLSGAAFRLIKNGTQTITLTADLTGSIFTSDDLEAGSYTLREITAPGNYQAISGDIITFEVDTNGDANRLSGADLVRVGSTNVYDIAVVNVPINVPVPLPDDPVIRIKKTDATGNPLSGASFALTNDITGTAVLTIDITGSIFTSGRLPAGLYTLRETTAPTGYQTLADDIVRFGVSANGDVRHLYGANIIQVGTTHVFEITVGNQRKYMVIPTNVNFPIIQIKNTDTDGNVLTGAVYELIKDGSVPVPLTPNADSSILTSDDLEDGSYELKLTSPPDNYEDIIGNIVTFDVDADGNILHKTGVNIIQIGNTHVFDITVISKRNNNSGLTLTGRKYLTGKALTDNMFAFVVRDMSGNIVTGGANAANGNIIFGTINYTAAGTYVYTVSEIQGYADGFTYDSTVYYITVTVTDNGNGTFSAVSNYQPGSLVFNNKYTAAAPPPNSGMPETSYAAPVPRASVPVQSTALTLKGTKELNGKALYDGMFNFTVKDENGNIISEGTNISTGEILFEPIRYTAAGTYTYTVSEEIGNKRGFTYDFKTHDVTVNVVNNNGVLTATAIYPSGGIKFTNSYKTQDTQVTLTGTKNLTGKTLEDSMFSFAVKDKNGNTVSSGTNNAYGEIVFDSIRYTSPGVYKYSVSEISGSMPGVTYDSSAYDVTVSVTDIGGELAATVIEPAGGISFNNSYEAQSTELSLVGMKKLTGKALEADMFSFSVKDENGNTVSTGKNSADGEVIFEPIIFNSAGTFFYTLTEAEGSERGIAYDANEYAVTVQVADNDGILKATPIYPDGGVVFCNNYEAPSTAIVLTGTKNLTGKALEDDMFVFVVKDETGRAVSYGTNNADGFLTFGQIVYTEPGTYVYTIEEVADNPDEYLYDDIRYTVIIIVDYDENNLLRASLAGIYSKDGEAGNGIAFSNSYAGVSNTYDVPKTGVRSMLPLWIAGLCLSVGSIVLIGFVSLKKRKQK